MIDGEELEVSVNRKKKVKCKPTQTKKVKDESGWSTVQLKKGQRSKRISQGFSNSAMSCCGS